MFQDFHIIKSDYSLCDKKIVIHASFDVDAENVSDRTISLLSVTSKGEVSRSYKVDGEVITITINEDIVPNSEYILKVSRLKNILGDSLTSAFRRSFTFKSEVRECPIILSPANYEELSTPKLKLAISLDEKQIELQEDKQIHIQIANDNAFINIVEETTTVEKEIALKSLIAGQYFVRARVKSITGSDIGEWSKVVTFLCTNKQAEPLDDEPEYIEEVELISYPVNGETPKSIMLEFSGEISTDYIGDILVIRRDI